MKSILILIAGLVFSTQAQADLKIQKYKITITSNWNKTDHKKLPGNAHFSPVVAVAHNSQYDLLPIGAKAGEGLELVAELGDTSDIKPEIQKAIMMGSVDNMVTTKNQFVGSQKTQSFEIELSNKHPYLSFVTMIAPSPDWVVGLSHFKLHSEEQGFYEGVKNLALYALNAGTESGDSAGNFSINNSATSPQETIDYLMGSGFQAPFAFVSITAL